MVSRRLRLLGVAIILTVSIALLTHQQYDATKWLNRPGSSDDEPSTKKLKFNGSKKEDDSETQTESLTVGATETASVTSSAPTTTTSAEPTSTGPPPPPEPTDVLPTADKIDWKKFAYIQYVTGSDYLCNSVMIFESLYNLGSRAKRVMMYPKDMLKDPKATEGKKPEEILLLKARDEYNVELLPIQVHEREGGDATFADSYTKFLAFKQTQFNRVLVLDSDSVVLQNMDELFLMPPALIAAPRAYWLQDEDPPKHQLSSQLMLLQPSDSEFDRVIEQVQNSAEDDYDMEIINQLYLNSAAVLPHRPYEILTSEFRKMNHTSYLGSDVEVWDPRKAFNEAKFLHFSDEPLPKPWVKTSEKLRLKYQPQCPEGRKRCPASDLWNGFYNEFQRRRERVCGLELE